MRIDERGEILKKSDSKSNEQTSEDTLSEVREHVEYAAALLRKMGPEKERIAWLLEDTLSFLVQSEQGGQEVLNSSTLEKEEVIDQLEELSRMVNE